VVHEVEAYRGQFDGPVSVKSESLVEAEVVVLGYGSSKVGVRA
jgi:hypothetical protein